jgi:hypothetical protein
MPDKTDVYFIVAAAPALSARRKALGMDFRLLRFIDLLEAKRTIVGEHLRALGYIQ